ncbi:MAG: AMP-binding protein, partial [Bacteroidota bacterium]
NPKGIMHSHASGLAFARNAVARYGLSEDDVFGNHAPIYFDISQLAYFASPLVGGTAVVATDAETIFPASLGQLIARERVTVWYSVPLAISQLLGGALPEALDLSALRRVFYAGEPLAPRYIRQLMARCPQVAVSNWYGPAETNVCTCYDLPGPPVGDEPIPLGEVWQNTARMIVGEDDQPVAPGEAGELVIRSTTSMLGYWNNPERNQRAWLVPDPAWPSVRYYRTGDRARIDPDGLLHFLGRADHQVKVRGYRVELGAVETVLLANPDVREAVAFTLPQHDGTLAIFAAVIPSSDAVDDSSIKRQLEEALPWYAVPKSIFLRASLPRTGSDKVDRPALLAELSLIE